MYKHFGVPTYNYMRVDRVFFKILLYTLVKCVVGTFQVK